MASTTHRPPRDSVSPDHDSTDPHSLDTLVRNLRTYLGHSSGITSDEVEVAELKALLDAYRPRDRNEWMKFGTPDKSKAYNRLLIDSINGRSNLLFLVWEPGRGSPIHDHASAHCVMKIIKGSLQEVVYHHPTSPGAQMAVKKSTAYRKDEITYISDDIGLHEVINNDQHEVSVSIHLYTPPNASDFGYHIFDRKTGKRSHVAGAKSCHN